jgi:hypothetical protein
MAPSPKKAAQQDCHDTGENLSWATCIYNENKDTALPHSMAADMHHINGEKTYIPNCAASYIVPVFWELSQSFNQGLTNK